MKVKNTPLAMDADDVALLAMAQLRGSGKLNDKNVDCFIQGYKSCSDALTIESRLIPVLKYHHKKLSRVEEDIDNAIGYADLRRGRTAEESARIKRATKIAEAIKNLIDILEEGGEK